MDRHRHVPGAQVVYDGDRGQGSVADVGSVLAGHHSRVDLQATGTYDQWMLGVVDDLMERHGTTGPSRPLEHLLPRVLRAGRPAGTLTPAGARLLDPSGGFDPGALVCPPEGDAGTGMVATNSVRPRTANVSVGTSVFAMTVLDAGRIGIASQALGIAEAAFEASVAYAKEREAFGQKIGEFQQIQAKLADMKCRIDASRLLIYQAALAKMAAKTGDGRYSLEASEAKLFASETAMWVTTQAIQIHGGMGYSKEMPLERYFRDAKITEIYEGTSEIQRMVIARALTGLR